MSCCKCQNFSAFKKSLYKFTKVKLTKDIQLKVITLVQKFDSKEIPYIHVVFFLVPLFAHLYRPQVCPVTIFMHHTCFYFVVLLYFFDNKTLFLSYILHKYNETMKALKNPENKWVERKKFKNSTSILLIITYLNYNFDNWFWVAIAPKELETNNVCFQYFLQYFKGVSLG